MNKLGKRKPLGVVNYRKFLSFVTKIYVNFHLPALEAISPSRGSILTLAAGPSSELLHNLILDKARTSPFHNMVP